MVVVGGIVLGLLLVCKLGCSIIGVLFIIVDFKLSNQVLIIVSLFLIFCRGFLVVIYDFLRLEFLDLIESVLQGDERCVFDIMCLVDFFLVLLFEG